MVATDQSWWIVISAIVYRRREITVSALRRDRPPRRAGQGGGFVARQVETIVQMVGLSFILAFYRSDLFGLPIYVLGIGLLADCGLSLRRSDLQAAWPELRKTTIS